MLPAPLLDQAPSTKTNIATVIIYSLVVIGTVIICGLIVLWWPICKVCSIHFQSRVHVKSMFRSGLACGVAVVFIGFREIRQIVNDYVNNEAVRPETRWAGNISLNLAPAIPFPG